MIAERQEFQTFNNTLVNQKYAVRFKTSTSLQYPLCGDPGSALHILSGCKHSTMSNVVTERHNVANRILLKCVSKDPLGAGFTSMDIDGADGLALQNLQTLNK
eukprot:700395-Pelagomonas_calceolata.AAC.1